MSGGEVPDGFWPALAGRLLHPVQVQIIEAIRWVDRPLSASELVQIHCEEHRLSTIAYHVRRLSDLEALRSCGQREPTRGSVERLYRLGVPDG
jgi:hypothetical protein